MDHGELNIPGRTSTINAELDRFKARQAVANARTAKAKAAETKALRAEAAGMVEAIGVERREAMAQKLGVTVAQLMVALRQSAYWQPAQFIAAERVSVANAARQS